MIHPNESQATAVTLHDQHDAEPGVLRVLCTDEPSYSPDVLALLEPIAQVDCVKPTRQFFLDHIGDYDACIAGADVRLDREIIERAHRLKVVVAPSTGTDHLDVEALHERRVRLIALTTEYELLDNFSATAECSWGLLLACLRRIPAGLEAVRRGDWARGHLVDQFPPQLLGKTLGVLGVGRLGKMVVEYGKAFRMRVLGCDLKEFHIEGVEQVDFDTFIKQSDVISVHVHLTDATRGLLSRESFARMKEGVVIVNTSRGAIIDESAFLQALESGKVAAAGIDVIDGEWMEDIAEHPLVRYAQRHDNLVITPHIGGATVESVVYARQFVARKLAECLLDMREKGCLSQC